MIPRALSALSTWTEPVIGGDDLLRRALPRVSRSFFLTLAILPRSLRRPIGLAYLLARAADTIADTRLVSREDRQGHLERFRAAVRQSGPDGRGAIAADLSDIQESGAERELLARLPEAFGLLDRLAPADQGRIRELLLTLTEGMLFDLRTFPGEMDREVQAIENREALRRYTYLVAGCVGEFWTEMAMSHRAALNAWDRDLMRREGVRFGQGLQLTNILRDLPRDLRIGRCYLPADELSAVGLRPGDLLDPSSLTKVRPLLDELLREALSRLDAGWGFTRSHPRREWRLRLAAVWPLLIGLETLARIAEAERLLDPSVTVKISRGRVRRILATSMLVVGSNRGLGALYEAFRRRTKTKLSLQNPREGGVSHAEHPGSL